MAEFAARHRHEGVVAFGIGGDEARGPARDFREVFDGARQAGLRLVAHAGEIAGTGVGVAGARNRSGENRARDSLDRRSGAGGASAGASYPAGSVRDVECGDRGGGFHGGASRCGRLFDAGVEIVLNTDDPAMFHTTLQGEYAVAREVFGFTDAEMERVRRNAWRYAFDAQAGED